MFKRMDNLTEVKKIIENEQLTFLYIGQKNCSVCHSLKPQIEKIVGKYSEIKMVEMDALDTPEVAGEFQVLTVPVLLLFVEGKEYLRKARIVNTGEFSEELHKIVMGVRSLAE